MEPQDKNLKIVTVAPITKQFFNEDLTYFTTKDLARGALVMISIRNREIPGVVTSVNPAEDLKSEIRSSEFNFKKIKKIITDKIYLSGFIDAVIEMAEYFVSSPGQIIRFLTPMVILESWQKKSFDPAVKAALTDGNDFKNRRFEISVLGLPDEERYPFYKSLIREEFAKKHSVIFILPTIHDAEECEKLLKKGIEEYTILTHSSLPAKTILERWQVALKEKHPILFIATSSSLSLPRDDVATIIIDRENSPFYKTANCPFVDIRTFAECLAKKYSARLILGDSIPRIEDIYNSKTGSFNQDLPLKYRFQTEINQEIIDMRKTGKEEVILSSKIKKIIQDSVDKKEHVLLICARKGLGTSTICSDCGEIVLCANCALPMVLYKIKDENVFSCNKCGEKLLADIKCRKCASWKLKVLGVATERVLEEVKLLMPNAKVFRVDCNTAKNYKQARLIVSEFQKTPGAILIGTEMVLTYLNCKVETVAVISIDALFSIPDFKINENIFDFLTRLRLITSKSFMVQTRKPEEKIFEQILHGDLLEFYKEEIQDRKKFNYPPFKTLIKITAEGPKEVTNKEMGQLEKFLGSYGPSKFNCFIERINNEERINILLKIDPIKWPQTERTAKGDSDTEPYGNLLEILKSLPKRFTVRVLPDNIL